MRSVYAFVIAFVFLAGSNLLSEQQDREVKQSAAAMLERAIGEHGIDGARARFRELLAGKDEYLFDASEFDELGKRLLDAGAAPEAVAVMEMAAELFPDEGSLLRRLAGAYFKAGEAESSLKTMHEVRSLEERAVLAEFLDRYRGDLAATAEEVIEKHIEAVGGREALEGVQTMVVKFSVNSTRGKFTTIVRSYKRPLFYRQEVLGSGGFIATDGVTVWRVTGDAWMEIEQDSYKRMASIDGYFIDFADRGITYDFAGVEILEGAPVYHLKRTFWDGYVQDLFFSVEYGYLTEIRSEYPDGDPVMLSYMSLWDYRDVGGIKIPHVFIRNVGQLGPPHGGVVEEVRINEPLDDGLFVEPK